MKNIIVAAAVFGVFVLYSLGIRHQLPVLSKPASLANNVSANSSTAPNTGGGSSSNAKQYNNGTYTGSVADAYYGNVQVSVDISGGKITAVKFLQYPDTHSTSVAINQQAMPYLQQETIQAQSANVQIISGATFTSQAFMQSLSSALARA
jgi:uncharacterized protein with FMN-binding domain